MTIDYSFPGEIGAHGLGGIAAQHVETLKEHGALGEVYQGLTRTGTGFNDWEHDAVVALQRRVRALTQHGLAGAMGWRAPLHAWGNAALSTILDSGSPVILERASTHPQWQQQVLHAEARRFGLGYEPTNALDVLRGSFECELAKVIVTPSVVSKDTFPAQQRERVVVVPFGTDTTRFYPWLDSEQAQAMAVWERTQEVVFGFLGGNWFRKGLVRLLDAWHRAELWKKDASLQVAGLPAAVVQDVAQQLHAQSLKAMNVLPNGRVPDQAEWLRGLDAFVLPSIEEGHAQVLIEAGATGLPVIATKACGHPFEDGKHGLLLPEAVGEPPKVEHIGAAMERLVVDEAARRAMGREHLAFVKKQFRWVDYRERLWRQAYKPIVEEAS